MKFLKKLDIHPWIYWIPVFIYMAIIFYFSSFSKIPQIEVVGFLPPINTAILHVIEYFGLSLLIGIAARHSKIKLLRENSYLIAIAISTIYGASDEFHQSFVPGRVMDFIDFLLDILGAVLAQIFRFILKKKKFFKDLI